MSSFWIGRGCTTVAFSRTTETGAVCTYIIDEDGCASYSDTEGHQFEGAVNVDVLCAICELGAMTYETYLEIIALVA